MCSQPGATSGLSMVLVYIEFFIDNGLCEGVHVTQGSGSEQSLGEGPEVQVGVYHIFCCRILRERRCKWSTEMWSSKAGALGIGRAQAMARVWPGRTHLAVHCLAFIGLSFHVGNICEWKRVKALQGGGSYSRPPYLWWGYQSQKMSGVYPRCRDCLLHTHTHTHTHIHTQPYTSPAIHGLSHEPVQTHGRTLCLLLWTILFCVTAVSQDHVGNKNRWLWLKGRTGFGMSLVARGLRPPPPIQCRGRGLYPWWENYHPTCLEATKPHVLHLLSPRALQPWTAPQLHNEDPPCCSQDLMQPRINQHIFS